MCCLWCVVCEITDKQTADDGRAGKTIRGGLGGSACSVWWKMGQVFCSTGLILVVGSIVAFQQ
jgi:hypothetical protein